MGSMNPHQDRSDYLAAFRRERPGADARRRNWRALQRRIDASDPARAVDDEADRPAPRAEPDLRRLITAVGLTFAIAASVLLAIRGLGAGMMAAKERRTPAMEASDQAPAPKVEQATPARPSRSVASSPANDPALADPNPANDPALADPSHANDPALADTGPANDPALADTGPANDPASASTPSPRPSTERPAPLTEPVDADALAAETQLLAQAREALAQDDLATAEATLERHARRFPNGALQEERLAYQAILRCRSTPPSSTSAEQFHARYPSSPHGPRVRAACDASTAASPH